MDYSNKLLRKGNRWYSEEELSSLREADPLNPLKQPVIEMLEPDLDVPTYRGAEKRKELFRRWGAPNAAPRPGESLFAQCRLLFVDDDSGRPIAYWVPR